MLDKVRDLLIEVEKFSPKSEKEVAEFRLSFLGKKGKQYFSGVKILEEDELNKNFDLIIITSLEDSLSRYKILKKMYGKDKVILPNVISKINLGRNNA